MARVPVDETRPAEGRSSDMTGLARRGLLSLGGAGVSAVANLLLIVVVARAVDKETAGYLFSTTSLFVVVESLCALGTATGLVYFIARHRALGESRLVRPLLRTALGPVLSVSVVAAVLMFVLAPYVGDLLGTSADEAVLFFRILAPFVVFAVLCDVLIAATQGFQVMTPTVLLEKIGRPVLQLVLLGVALLVGLSWTLPVAWMGPYVVELVLVLVALRGLLRRDDRAAAPAETEPPRIDRTAFWVYTAPRGLAAAAQLTLQRLDIVLVAAFLGAAPAAVYTAATRFVVLGQLGNQAVALAVQPKFSELMAHEDIDRTRQVYRTSTAWVLAVTWPVHLLVAMLSPLLMRLFGHGYGDGRPVMVILAMAMLVATGCGMVTMLLLMSGRSRENLFNVVVALVSNLVLNVLLIPRMGIEGAAVAWAAAIVLSNLLPLYQIQRAYGLNPFGPASLRVALLAVACFVALPGLAWLASGATGVVVGAVALATVLYAVGLYLLRHVLQLDDLIGSVRHKVAR
jgi:O-antigen/teichoic acid export membrane protein